MRKFIYSVAALAMTLSFSACGNKTDAAAEGADSAKEEAVAEAPTTFCENEDLSVTGPEGWEVKEGSFGAISMEDVNSKEMFKPKIEVRIHKDKTLKDQEDYYLNKTHGTKKGADVTIGEYTFKTFRDDSSKLYHCFAELADGRLLELYTVYIEPEVDVVKPVVESIKVK